jgi:hypothetical protein
VTRVGVQGEGPLRRALVDGLVAAGVGLARSPDTPDATIWLSGEPRGEGPHLLLGGEGDAPVFHSTLPLPAERTARVPAAPVVAALHAVAGLAPTAIGLTEIAPAPAGPGGGPIDALVPLAVPACEPGLPAGVPAVRRQALVAPHTRCWLVGLSLEGADPAAQRALLSPSPPCCRVPSELGVADTAALAEMCRDRGSRDGSFTEVFVFGADLRATGGRVDCWLAVHERVRVAEALAWVARVSAPGGDRELAGSEL